MMSNVPKLRFKEFSGEWEEKLLDKIAVFSKGKGVSKADLAEDGKTKCIRYGELYTQYNELIENIVSSTNVDEENLVLSEYGDIIIPASGETQIDIATASCVLKDNIALGGDLNIIKTQEDGVFLSYYLNNTKKLDIARLSQGISVVHLYSSQLKTLKLNLPSKQEQEKIASFLTSVNNKIEQLTKKEELLSSYKKGVMQKIFNQEIRFKADDGSEFTPWEKYTLDEVANRYDNLRIPVSSSNRTPGNIPYYGATSVMDYVNEYVFDDTYLLIGEDGSVLKEDGSPFVQYIWGESWVNNHAHVLQGTSGISTEFLMIFMQAQNITAYVTGAVQLKLNQKNMNSIPFLKASDSINQLFVDCINPLYLKFKMLTEENKTLTNLRDTLLPKLISGELRIPDAEKLVEEVLI